MKTVLLINSPFCTPVTAQYAIANIYSFLKLNLDKNYNIKCLDLNAIYHKEQFNEHYNYFKNFNPNFNIDTYNTKAKEFRELSSKKYKEINKDIRESKYPIEIKNLVSKIIDYKPDFCAFSIVYSSQAFVTYKIIEELKKQKIKTIVGGPAVNQKLIDISNAYLKNEFELLDYITNKQNKNTECIYPIDFSEFEPNDYYSPNLIIPIKTSSACYYKQCAFCTHHNNAPYFEYDLSKIENTIKNSKTKYVFLIDDMIHKKRLLDIAKIMKKLKVNWICQLKPTKEFDESTLKILYESGLKVIIWGVESANNRVLNMMKKGTNIEEITKVLNDSKKSKIKNVVYIMAGFPSETKEELLDTINFLKNNSNNIDLISTSVFGLQQNTYVFNNPTKFGITQIHTKKRSLLEDSYSYDIKNGLSQNEAKNILKKYKKTIEKINKFPKNMNFFREHMLILNSEYK